MENFFLSKQETC